MHRMSITTTVLQLLTEYLEFLTFCLVIACLVYLSIFSIQYVAVKWFSWLIYFIFHILCICHIICWLISVVINHADYLIKVEGKYGKESICLIDREIDLCSRSVCRCCSYNADMLPDLLVEKTPGLWTVYLADIVNGFVAMQPLSRSPLVVPHSSAFINLLEDFAAGRFFTICRSSLNTCGSWSQLYWSCSIYSSLFHDETVLQNKRKYNTKYTSKYVHKIYWNMLHYIAWLNVLFLAKNSQFFTLNMAVYHRFHIIAGC